MYFDERMQMSALISINIPIGERMLRMQSVWIYWIRLLLYCQSDNYYISIATFYRDVHQLNFAICYHKHVVNTKRHPENQFRDAVLFYDESGWLHFLFLLSVLEEILYGFVGNHLLIKCISTGLGTLDHFDDFGIGASVGLTFLKCCDCFLCHGLII